MVTNREMSYFKRILQQVQVGTQSRTVVSLDDVSALICVG